MELSSAFPGLEDLVDVGQDSELDMRPTLLRVLTDLYLQRPGHTPEDERYYTELVLRLIEAVGVAARMALAERLARYPGAPSAILLALARDQIEIAAPILKHTPCLTQAELAALAAELGGAHAQLIAARTPADVPDQQATTARDFRVAEACELSELFYTASASERRWILIGLGYAPITPAQPAAPMQRTDIWQLESAALQDNMEFVIRELERSLAISRIQARRVASDESGEPIVVAAKALELPADVLQRMLLFMNPRIGQSVDRVYELGQLFAELPIAAARRLLAIWRVASAADSALASHEKIAWRAAAENARRALSEVSRRPALKQFRSPQFGIAARMLRTSEPPH
jgi:hypothetical protein